MNIEEIKEGMYVRTKKGIEKITCIENNFMGDKKKIFIATDNDEWRGVYNGYLNGFINKNNIIIKSSKNIIDLIQVGDYVNGLPVVHNAKNNGGNIVIVVNGKAYNEEDIKSIVTKEQFEIMAYEVEE